MIYLAQGSPSVYLTLRRLTFWRSNNNNYFISTKQQANQGAPSTFIVDITTRYLPHRWWGIYTTTGHASRQPFFLWVARAWLSRGFRGGAVAVASKSSAT